MPFIIIIVLIIIFCIPKKEIKKVNRPNMNVLGYKIFYTDSNYKNNAIKGTLLKSDKYRLQGKPDFILKHLALKKYIVVELKSGTVKDMDKPKFNDLMQLVTYFLIVEDLYKKPRYGKLIYKDHMFIVRNTKRLRRQLLAILKDMETMKNTGVSKKAPEVSYPKCKHCICKEVCEFCDLFDK